MILGGFILVAICVVFAWEITRATLNEVCEDELSWWEWVGVACILTVLWTPAWAFFWWSQYH